LGKKKIPVGSVRKVPVGSETRIRKKTGRYMDDFGLGDKKKKILIFNYLVL